MKTLLVVKSGWPLGFRLPAYRAFWARGWRVAVVDQVMNQSLRFADIPIVGDVADSAALAEMVLQRVGRPDGILTFNDSALVASYLYAALVPFLWLLVLPATPPYQQAAPFPWQGIYDALRNRQLLALTAVVAAFWILNAQFTITVPLAFAAMSRTQALGLVFVLNAVLVAVGQVPILQMVSRMSKNVNQQRAAGLVLVGLGLGSIALTFPSWISAIVLSVLLSLGEMLVVPNLDLSAGKLAKNGLTGTYFGVTSLGWMVRGWSRGVFGGAVLQFGRSHSVPSLLWLVCAGFATMVAMVAYIGLQWLV